MLLFKYRDKIIIVFKVYNQGGWMKKKRIVVTVLVFVFAAMLNSGCAAIGAAISAGAAYGIYQATRQ